MPTEQGRVGPAPINGDPHCNGCKFLLDARTVFACKGHLYRRAAHDIGVRVHPNSVLPVKVRTPAWCPFPAGETEAERER